MKLHDLRPAPGSVTERTRVGRGIAAGKGKTAGRGTKGQKSRSGGSIPAGFEGGQTPIHRRVPKLRGFKNRFKIHYEVVNVGRIASYAEAGRFAEAETANVEASRPSGRGKTAPLTVNAELLRSSGLIGTLRQPVKILGGGDVERPLFVVADAFTRSARQKIEAAGGTAQLLVVPTESLPAVGLDAPAPVADGVEPTAEASAAEGVSAEAPAAEPATESVSAEPAPKARQSRARKSRAAATPEDDAPEAPTAEPADAPATDEPAPQATDEATAEAKADEAAPEAAPEAPAEAPAAEPAGEPAAETKPASRRRRQTEPAE